jgi:hypothetical protein
VAGQDGENTRSGTGSSLARAVFLQMHSFGAPVSTADIDYPKMLIMLWCETGEIIAHQSLSPEWLNRAPVLTEAWGVVGDIVNKSARQAPCEACGVPAIGARPALGNRVKNRRKHLCMCF